MCSAYATCLFYWKSINSPSVWLAKAPLIFLWKLDLHLAVSISTNVFFATSLMLKTEQIVILTKEEEYLVRHFQSNGIVNPCDDWVLSQAKLLFTKIIWCFLCLVNIFYYHEHLPLWPSGSCLLANCQLHNIA